MTASLPSYCGDWHRVVHLSLFMTRRALAHAQDSVEWLSGMLRDIFTVPKSASVTAGASAGDERKRRRAAALAVAASTACAPLVAAVREYMLQLDGEVGAGLPPEPGAPSAEETCTRLVACATAMRTFARASGKLVAPHFEMLAPYVRGLPCMDHSVRCTHAVHFAAASLLS